MKGLTKENNVNRKKILKVIRNKNYIKCMIFNFGQVYLYLTFYYKKFVKKEKFIIDLKYGNTTSSSIPIALKRALEKKKIKKNHRVIICGFGVGLAWGVTSIIA